MVCLASGTAPLTRYGPFLHTTTLGSPLGLDIAVSLTWVAGALEVTAQAPSLNQGRAIDKEVAAARPVANNGARRPAAPAAWSHVNGEETLARPQTDPQARQEGLQAAAKATADRAGETAPPCHCPRPQGARDPRRPRQRRQGWHHQAHRRAPEPARGAGRGARQAERSRAQRVVLPALYSAVAGCPGDRAVQSQLVQPRRR